MRKFKRKISAKAASTSFFLAVLVIFISGNVLAAAITLSDAEDAIKKSENTVNYISSLGFDPTRFMDLLQDAKYSFEHKDYESVVEDSNKISELKDIVISLKGKITTTKSLVDNAGKMGIDSSFAADKLNESIEEFNSNSYESSNKHADESYDAVGKLLENKLAEDLMTIETLRNLTFSENLGLIIIDDSYRKVNETFALKKFSEAFVVNEMAISLNRSVFGLVKAKGDIREMSSHNLTTSRVDDLFKEAVIAEEFSNFDKVLEFSRQISSLKEKSYDLEKKIGETSESVKKLETDNLDSRIPKQYLNSAIEKFSLNNYEEAENLLSIAAQKADEARASSLIFGLVQKSRFKFNIINFIKTYWWAFVVAALFGLVLTFTAGKAVSAMLIHKKIISLKKEQEAIINLIKKLQEDYFKKKTISRHSYEIILDKHQSRMLKINEMLPVLHSKLAKKQGHHNKL